MLKPLSVIIFTTLLFSNYNHASGITCWGNPCNEIARQVFLQPTSLRKVIHLYIIDNDIKIPVFAGMSNIGTGLTRPKNSFDSVFYYGENQSISVSFYDVDYDIDLLPKPNEILLFRNDGISVLFYEASHSKSHPQTPLFEAVIPIKRGDKDRFIMYATKGISKEEFTTLLSKLELSKS